MYAAHMYENRHVLSEYFGCSSGYSISIELQNPKKFCHGSNFLIVSLQLSQITYEISFVCLVCIRFKRLSVAAFTLRSILGKVVKQYNH